VKRDGAVPFGTVFSVCREYVGLFYRSLLSLAALLGLFCLTLLYDSFTGLFCMTFLYDSCIGLCCIPLLHDSFIPFVAGCALHCFCSKNCSTLRHSATHCFCLNNWNTLQRIFFLLFVERLHGVSWRVCFLSRGVFLHSIEHVLSRILFGDSTHCNKLQHIATCCNRLQLVILFSLVICWEKHNALQHIAIHCNTLLHTAIR